MLLASCDVATGWHGLTSGGGWAVIPITCCDSGWLQSARKESSCRRWIEGGVVAWLVGVRRGVAQAGWLFGVSLKLRSSSFLERKSFKASNPFFLTTIIYAFIKRTTLFTFLITLERDRPT